MKKFWMVAIAIIFLLSACGGSTTPPAVSQNGIEIYSPWAASALSGGSTAAFMSIKNTNTAADTLVSASTDAGMMVQLMTTGMDSSGNMAMSDVSGIDIPAGSTVELKSGGYHIMLMNLMQDLKEGSTMSITLTFTKAGTINMTIPVKMQGSMP